MSIMDQIQSHTASLSTKQKNIAKYLIKNRNKIAFMSMKELSHELEVTEVTLLNFCKAIGLESFVELKKAFQESMTDELKIPAKMKSSLEEIMSVEEAVENTIQIQRQNMERLSQHNSVSLLDEASALIHGAKTIYICGLGVSEMACDFLQSALLTLNLDARRINLENGTQVSGILMNASSEDLFILMSFPNYSEKTIKLAQYLEMHQLPFLSVTNSDTSPIAKGAKVVLKTDNFSLVFYNFISSTLALLEILLVVLSYRMKDVILPKIKDLDELNDFFSTHENQPKKAKK